EKQSLKDKLKSPLVATMIAVSVTTVGLFGASSFGHSKEAKADEQITHSIDNINQFKKTNSAKYPGNGTTLTIRADKRLKTSAVKAREGDRVNVEREAG